MNISLLIFPFTTPPTTLFSSQRFLDADLEAIWMREIGESDFERFEDGESARRVRVEVISDVRFQVRGIQGDLGKDNKG